MHHAVTILAALLFPYGQSRQMRHTGVPPCMVLGRAFQLCKACIHGNNKAVSKVFTGQLVEVLLKVTCKHYSLQWSVEHSVFLPTSSFTIFCDLL